jgi:hypothetical protein
MGRPEAIHEPPLAYICPAAAAPLDQLLPYIKLLPSIKLPLLPWLPLLPLLPSIKARGLALLLP